MRVRFSQRMGRPQGTIATATRNFAVLSAAALLTLSATGCELPLPHSASGTSSTVGDGGDIGVPKPPSAADTPELDSVVLFGAGLIGAAGYFRRTRKY